MEVNMNNAQAYRCSKIVRLEFTNNGFLIETHLDSDAEREAALNDENPKCEFDVAADGARFKVEVTRLA